MASCETTVTVDDVRAMAARDVAAACAESGSAETPDGGWDAWLVNGLGVEATCRLFGEPPAASESGWSAAMVRKLRAYHEAATNAVAS